MKARSGIVIFTASMIMFLTGCNANKAELFDTPFVTFSYTNSSSTSVDAESTFDAQYYIHLSSRKLDGNLEVQVSAVPGTGLKEGVDYELVTEGGKVVFYPGIYDMPFRIKWLKNKIDPTLDNTLTLRLESCNMDGVYLGMPGPAEKMRSISINKYILD